MSTVFAAFFEDNERLVPLFDSQAQTHGQILKGRGVLADDDLGRLLLRLLAAGDPQDQQAQGKD